ncbi:MULTISPECIES: hypothetical protein [Aeromonas]|uniref:Uncharacterized protein n=1 Tax=Aeromonas veronii TaxID=654 RepID=A0A4S5CGK1_AERVE|nr:MULTISPECIES: hypothetical protein [Aeromonas]THJ43591.1 hypothetical protein E8Q35_14895 [Aeromonas veronii]
MKEDAAHHLDASLTLSDLQALAVDSKSSVEVLKDIEAMNINSLSRLVAANPNSPPELLEVIRCHNGYSADVYEAALINPNVSLKSIQNEVARAVDGKAYVLKQILNSHSITSHVLCLFGSAISALNENVPQRTELLSDVIKHPCLVDDDFHRLAGEILVDFGHNRKFAEGVHSLAASKRELAHDQLEKLASFQIESLNTRLASRPDIFKSSSVVSLIMQVGGSGLVPIRLFKNPCLDLSVLLTGDVFSSATPEWIGKLFKHLESRLKEQDPKIFEAIGQGLLDLDRQMPSALGDVMLAHGHAELYQSIQSIFLAQKVESIASKGSIESLPDTLELTRPGRHL